MGGGKSPRPGAADQASAAAAQTQARIAEQMFQEATPLRRSLFGAPGRTEQIQVGFRNVPLAIDGEPLKNGGFQDGFRREPIFETREVSGRPGLIEEILQPRAVESIADLTRTVVRPATQAGIDTARQNILRTVPRGGLQRRLLADVERSAVEQLATQEAEFAIGDIGRREAAEEQRAGRIFQAAAPALGASQIGVTGLGSSAATLGQLGAAQSARSSQAKTGAGQLAGTLVGASLPFVLPMPAPKGPTCWLALALYGPCETWLRVAHKINTGSSWRSRLSRLIYRIMQPIFNGLLKER